MAFCKKLFNRPDFHHQIVRRRASGYLNVLHPKTFLRKPFFLFTLLFFVPELVVAHQPHHRRLCIRRNFNQINSFVGTRKRKRLFPRQNTEVLPVLTDDAQLLRDDLAVNTWLSDALMVSWKPMEANPPEEYRTLGRKTLTIFILQRIQTAFILLLISIALFAIQGEPFLAQVGIPNFGQYVAIAAEACLAAFFIFFVFGFLVAWLVYINYKFALTEDSLKVKRGVLDKEEVAIPYRQIQDVDIDRDLSFQMIGLSRIVILTAGHEDRVPADAEPGQSEGVLPALDKDLASWLQTELLQRANIQKVVESKPQA